MTTEQTKEERTNIAESYIESLQGGFFGFWVKRWRVTFLLMGLIIVIGLTSLQTIPKESTPTISFGVVSVTTVYPGVSPTDIDSIITDKIETEIHTIEGIDTINSTSAVGVSNIVVTLKSDADTSKVLGDIKDKVDNISLPEDVKDPIIQEISTENQKIFELLLYADSQVYSLDYLRTKARELEASIEGTSGIDTIDLVSTPKYQVSVLLSQGSLDELGITPNTVAQSIRAYNSNWPLGSNEVGSLRYDFSLQGEKKSLTELENISVSLPSGETIPLHSIAEIRGEYDDDIYQALGFYNKTGFIYVAMVVNKPAGMNVFQASQQAKDVINKQINTYAFDGISATYTSDLADTIGQDYENVASNGLQTIVFCFLFILLFVGFKEATIASLTIPLSFMITFFVLDRLGLSLNFLTNFSLIITFGVAVDTAICIIEGTNEKIRMGYNPKSAALLAVREFSVPLVASTLTTCIVFLPMLTLPGITGKFLAYIPITIFVTLLATLGIALTIPPAIYFKLTGRTKYYDDSLGDDGFMSVEEKALLMHDREGKVKQEEHHRDRREKFLGYINTVYSNSLARVIATPRTRLIAFLMPLGLLLLSFVFIVPQLGFKLFPSGDEGYVFFDIKGQEGTQTKSMLQYTDKIDEVLSSLPEVKTYYYTIKENGISVNVELLPLDQRKKRKQRDSFAIEELVLQELAPLASQGVRVSSRVLAGGPPTSKAVGISLIAETTDDLETLSQVAQDVEAFVHTLTGSKNVSNSSESSPGQFVFSLSQEAMQQLGITPNDIGAELFTLLNGINAGTYKDSLDSYDIRVQVKELVDSVEPQSIEALTISTRKGPIQLDALIDYTLTNSISQITREDGKILIKIEADVDGSTTPDKVQTQLLAFAEQYNFPESISYEAGGESDSDSELIVAAQISFVVAMLLIFGILVLTFNSFLQPIIAFYSILMSLLGVFIGLYITGNPLSMSFAIGFIALTGVVVTDAIVFIDRVNENKNRGMETYQAIIQTGKSRIQPILLNTSSAILGSIGTAQQDPFFAGLGYTIIFGLMVASMTTLFVIPALYYQKHTLIMVIKRSLLALVVYVSIPLLSIAVIIGGLYGIGIPIDISSGITKTLILMAIVAFFFVYIAHIIKAWSSSGQTIIEQWMGIRVINDDGTTLSHRQSVVRLVVQMSLLPVGPLLLMGLLATVIGSIGIALGALVFVGVGVANFASIWLSEDHKALHDRILGTKVVEVTTK